MHKLFIWFPCNQELRHRNDLYRETTKIVETLMMRYRIWNNLEFSIIMEFSRENTLFISFWKNFHWNYTVEFGDCVLSKLSLRGTRVVTNALISEFIDLSKWDFLNWKKKKIVS